LKYESLKEFYSYISQPVPKISEEKLGLRESGSDEDYYNAFLLSRIANLPLRQTFKNYAVSDWIRSMLASYYRSHNILIPNPEELTLGDTRRQVTGALAIGPESGTYFNMHVLDFESLYPGCIDVFNLSYETIQCSHSDCRTNKVPGQPLLHVCTKRRGIYSALVGALRDLRLQVYKPEAKRKEADSNVVDASRLLKTLLVSCYGVTIRIKGLASPLLGESITAYGRYVLQSTWDLAKRMNLNPKYSDTDSLFLKSPSRAQIETMQRWADTDLGVELDLDKVYRYVAFSSRKKNYFGVLPDGTVDIRGLTGKKSQTPEYLKETFYSALEILSRVQSPEDFEKARASIKELLGGMITNLKGKKVPVQKLAFNVMMGKPTEKYNGTTPQHVRAAKLLEEKGREVKAGEMIAYVKTKSPPYVKPVDLARVDDVDSDKYIEYAHSMFDQMLDALDFSFDEIMGATTLDFFWSS
jgi:DNA polymerase I